MAQSLYLLLHLPPTDGAEVAEKIMNNKKKVSIGMITVPARKATGVAEAYFLRKRDDKK